MHRLLLGVSSAALALAAALPAAAQSIPDTEATTVQAVVATAQRREQASQEIGLALDHVADVVRQAAVRERDVRTLLDHDDLGVLVESPQSRGT